MSYTDLPNDQVLEDTVKSLEKNGFVVHVVEKSSDAKDSVERMLAEGSNVMQMTSVTLDQTGISELINTSGKYDAGRNRLFSDGVSDFDKKVVGYAADYAVGSVHALTQNGELMIASNTGSQLGAYLYGATKVIFVVSTQKIVKDLEEAKKRVYDHVLPLESDRAHKAYGVEGSFVSKLAIISREIVPERIHIVLVKEQLGF